MLHLVQEWERSRRAVAEPLWAVGDPIYAASDPRLHEGDSLAPASQAALTEYLTRAGHAGEGGFHRLRYSGEEVQDIGHILAAAPNEVQTGLGASEGMVKEASRRGELAQARYVHLATHARLRE